MNTNEDKKKKNKGGLLRVKPGKGKKEKYCLKRNKEKKNENDRKRANLLFTKNKKEAKKK